MSNNPFRLLPMRGVALALAVLLALPGALAASPSSSSASTSSSTPSGPAWWDSSYAYRVNVTLTNPENVTLVEHPFFIGLSFPAGHLFDASSELRLVNPQTGSEVQSYVLDQFGSGGFVTSAWLLVLANLQPLSNQTLQLYYGDSAATLPTYRQVSQSANVTGGQLAVSLAGTQPGSPSFAISYGGTYGQAIYSSLSYGQPGASASFGDPKVAQSVDRVASPWTVQSGQTFQVASSAYTAGVVRYSEAVLVTNDTVEVARLVTNLSNSSVSGATVTDVVDSSGFSLMGEGSVSYNTTSGALLTEVAGAWFGYSGAPAKPDAFEVGAAGAVVPDVRSGSLDNSTFAAGIVAGALRWSLGSISVGGSAELLTGWSIGSSASGVDVALSSLSSRGTATAGNLEQSLAPASPSPATSTISVNSYWNASLPIENLTVPASGATVPLPLAGDATVSSGALSGVASYSIQAGFGPSSGFWRGAEGSNAGAVASASGSMWSFPLQAYTGTALVYSPANSSGIGAAELTSGNMSFPASSSRSLVIRYMASFVGAGDLSSTSLYAAVDLRTSASGPFNETFVLPALQTSTADSQDCSSLLYPHGVPHQAPSVGSPKLLGQLVPDGTWRTISINLNSLVGSSAVTARVRLCAATSAPFPGQIAISVASAGVQVTTHASNLLSASALPGSDSVQLSMLPGLPYSPPSVEFTGTVAFSVLEHVPLTWRGGAVFNGTVLAPGGDPSSGTPGAAGNSTSNSTQTSGNVTRSPRATASLISTKILVPSAMGTYRVYVNESLLQGSPFNGSASIPNAELESPSGSLYSAAVTLRLTAYSLDVNVKDANGSPLKGVAISVSGQGIPSFNGSATGASGSSSLVLFPGSYTVSAVFQGSQVGSASVKLDSNQSASIAAGVYEESLAVTTQLGAPLPGATVVLQGTSTNETLVTNSTGGVTFKAVANAQYGVVVSLYGTTYYTGTINTPINGEAFSVKTSYVPNSVELPVLTGAVVALLAASIGVYLIRRRRA